MRALRAAAGLAASAALIALFLRGHDLSALATHLRAADHVWIAAATACYACALAARGERWRMVLRGVARTSRADATATLIVGAAVNNVLAFRAGEFVRAQMLHDRTGVDRAAALGALALERALDGLVLLAFLALALGWVGGALLAAAAAAAAAACAGAWALIALSINRDRWRPRLARLPVGRRARAIIAPAAMRAWIGATAVRGRRAWAVVWGMGVLSWALEACTYWLVGISLGLSVHPIGYFGACAMANLAAAIPWTAGGIGPFELAARWVVVRFGAPPEAATAWALALHAFLLIPIIAVGAALIWGWRFGRSATSTGASEPHTQRVPALPQLGTGGPGNQGIRDPDH